MPAQPAQEDAGGDLQDFAAGERIAEAIDGEVAQATDGSGIVRQPGGKGVCWGTGARRH